MSLPLVIQITQEDISFFRSVLPSNCLVVDNQDELLSYNTDWLRKYRGKSRLVAKPKTTEQVSKLMKYCNDRKLAIVPQGGNTGLVGGSVPVFDEIIINTKNMNNIRSFDSLSVQFTDRKSWQVLPDGTILDGLVTLRKDNTGYDLKQLFIGSEGTLGIVTGVSIQTPRKPKAINVSLLGLSSFENVQEAYIRSKEELSEILSAFEFWDAGSIKLIKDHNLVQGKLPLEDDYPFYVLVEVSGSNKKLLGYLENLLEKDIAKNAVVAQDETQFKTIWSIREKIPEACSKAGALYKYDVSIPLEFLYKMVEDARHRLKGAVNEVTGFGHIGDGNLHLNITAESYTPEITALIEPWVYEWIEKYRGSISAGKIPGLFKTETYD
ncbi:6300_t:CDS:2 [Acaulospora colombiana]|uniref:6300_t:CDS:1 n=1 Tax=Acaulospora colombiana TaxID=27376 RepID=A0ACA9K7N2_9GLOM|nr:6300_t:CDS:2 [Acaulospora colombiana]